MHLKLCSQSKSIKIFSTGSRSGELVGAKTNLSLLFAKGDLEIEKGDLLFVKGCQGIGKGDHLFEKGDQGMRKGDLLIAKGNQPNTKGDLLF